MKAFEALTKYPIFWQLLCSSMEFQHGDDDRRMKAFLFSSGTTLRAYAVIVLIDRLWRMIGDCRTVLHFRENREIGNGECGG
jgi:hypothetical protein